MLPYGGFLERSGPKFELVKPTFNVKNSVRRFAGLSVVISAQFAVEMCAAAHNRQKVSKTSILAFKVTQGHRSWCKSKASIRLPISD